MPKGKKKIKVQDLKPKKDAKGGIGPHKGDHTGGHTTGHTTGHVGGHVGGHTGQH